MNVTVTHTKVAMIRRPGIPANGAAPLYLNCPCGAEPDTTMNGLDVTCTCGRVYNWNGYVL